MYLIILRTLTALDAIIIHCTVAQSNPQSNAPASQSNCVGFDWLSALASHGARGLFLLAYQGDSPPSLPPPSLPRLCALIYTSVNFFQTLPIALHLITR